MSIVDENGYIWTAYDAQAVTLVEPVEPDPGGGTYLYPAPLWIRVVAAVVPLLVLLAFLALIGAVIWVAAHGGQARASLSRRQFGRVLVAFSKVS